MSLRVKVELVLFVVVGLVVGLTYGIQRFLILPGLDPLEEQVALKDLAASIETLDAQRALLDDRCSSWASQPGLADFVLKKNEKNESYTDSFLENTMTTENLNLIYIVTAYGGIVWGIRADKFPQKQFRCLVVKYFRLGPKEPAKLTVRELVLTQFSFDDVRKTSGRFIAVHEITPPDGPDAILQVTVDDDGILVRFDERIEWRPVDRLNRTDWLPDGKGAVGITGMGRDVVLRDLSIRSLP